MAHQASGMSDDDMAALQKLSDDFQPEISGPLVGQREPSTAITAEYASADPVFQAKTASLPQKYSHYRKMRGDGKCGWRAIAFGYFEALIHFGNENKFVEEEARLRSLHNVVNNAGYSPYLYEDFADAVFDILRKLSVSLQIGNAEELLLESFNDETEQNYVITYFKTLTCSWMKAREGDYAPWLPGQSVTAFVDSQVMPIGSEIENVSMSALKDVLLSPASIQLEVLYLDRTDGVEPNMHRFDPQNSAHPIIGSIRLLYRPGHYDIVYKTEDVPQSTTSVQTYLQYHNETHNEPVMDLGMSDFMTMIPGMSYAGPQQSWLPGAGYGYSDYLASPPASMPALVESPELQSRTQSMYIPTPRTQMVPPSDEMPQDMDIRSDHHEETQPHFSGQSQTSPFRSSYYQFEPGFVSATSHVPFKTAIFKNSHFNTAHFLNPDFQPEEWRPEDEPMLMTNHSKGGRHNSFG
ncbi:Hypothetical protein R9X50_00456600 [Acrodontium crateriforme]|uniref:ubiquitinyl hydrolase 1 n=1 Tax=Acrodontium crateriforme TaxID=150365 RepID=A0AAQ3M4W1_9PEZI|nr:Hypothetical protein R9X50_00456600 [Acrodontium crateriforme]